MSDEVDEELVQLRETKGKLLAEAIDWRRELDTWAKAEGRNARWIEKYNNKSDWQKDFLPATSEFHELVSSHDEVLGSVNKKNIQPPSFMMGLKFNEVDKQWTADHKYIYTANVKSKALKFFLEVTVDAKDASNGLEILGIVCHFVNLRECYSLEITPWVHRFTEEKDTANLFRTMSDYTEHNVTRTTILKNIQEYNVAFVQEHTEADGGIMVFLQAKKDPDFIYFEIRWVLKFVESLWRIDNFFEIEPISAGADFLKEINQLLQRFCKHGIKNDDLQDLWNKLCSAVEQDDSAQSTTGTTSS